MYEQYFFTNYSNDIIFIFFVLCELFPKYDTPRIFSIIITIKVSITYVTLHRLTPASLSLQYVYAFNYVLKFIYCIALKLSC